MVVLDLIFLFHFSLQEIIRYINRSLQEKKLLYFGMENLDFGFIDPVSLTTCKQIKAPNFILAVLCYSPVLNDFILCHIQSLSCLLMLPSCIFSGCLQSCCAQSK